MNGLKTAANSSTQSTHWTRDSLDIHVHAAPSIFDRWGTAWDLAQACLEAEMNGFVLKFHHGSSVEIAAAVQAMYPALSIYGGVALNHFVGGINPLAVETCVRLGGKIVWLPTIHAVNHGNCCGPLGGFGFQKSKTMIAPPGGIEILDQKNELRVEMKEVLQLLHGDAVVLATGHISPNEIYELVRYIERNHIDLKLLINHVSFKAPALEVSQLRELTRSWVWFETVHLCTSPLVACTPVRKIADSIRALPDSNWIIATDSGQKNNLKSPQALDEFASQLNEAGVDKLSLYKMMKVNPKILLGAEG